MYADDSSDTAGTSERQFRKAFYELENIDENDTAWLSYVSTVQGHPRTDDKEDSDVSDTCIIGE